jgi:hypothetical protein
MRYRGKELDGPKALTENIRLHTHSSFVVLCNSVISSYIPESYKYVWSFLEDGLFLHFSGRKV